MCFDSGHSKRDWIAGKAFLIKQVFEKVLKIAEEIFQSIHIQLYESLSQERLHHSLTSGVYL